MGLFWWLRRTAVGPKADKLMLAGNGQFDFDVAVESHDQRELQQAARERNATADRVDCLAVLFPSGDPSDSNAVGVMVGSRLVGRLPRELAGEFRKRANQLGLEKGYCRAVIVRGEKGSTEYGIFGIKLDLKWPVDIPSAIML